MSGNNKPVRLSPSGPNLSNSGGAPFAPGAGARIRLAEASTTITGTITIPTTPTQLANPMGGTSFVESLVAPDPALHYRATVLVDVLNPTTNANAAVELYIDTSTDNGATWTEQASNSHLVGFSGARQVRCDMKLVLGSTLGLVAGTANLYTRVRIGASSGGGVVLVESASTPSDLNTSVGSVLLQLEECF